MDGPITLRKASRDDLPALVPLGQEACLSSIDQLPEFRGRRDQVTAAFAVYIPRQIDRTVVLESAGTILGFASSEPASGEITDLWVKPCRQGEGLGSILIAGAEAAIRQAGHSCSWLTTHALNRRALSFYRTQGYALLAINEAAAETLPDVTYRRALLGKQLSRPDPARAATMEDVRAGIDTLDPMILSLLDERYAFIDRAAQIKPALSMPARVDERVEEVVTNARMQAASIGFDADLAEKLWRTMIDLAIAREERKMLAGETPFERHDDSA